MPAAESVFFLSKHHEGVVEFEIPNFRCLEGLLFVGPTIGFFFLPLGHVTDCAGDL